MISLVRWIHLMACTSHPRAYSSILSLGIPRTPSGAVGREIVVSLLTMLGSKKTHIGRFLEWTSTAELRPNPTSEVQPPGRNCPFTTPRVTTPRNRIPPVPLVDPLPDLIQSIG